LNHHFAVVSVDVAPSASAMYSCYTRKLSYTASVLLLKMHYSISAHFINSRCRALTKTQCIELLHIISTVICCMYRMVGLIVVHLLFAKNVCKLYTCF